MRSAEISILAGGWSARAYDVHRLPGLVIGVNDAGIWAPCDAIVSMDRLWTENRWTLMAAMAKPAWIRTAALKGRPPHYPPWLNRFDCDHTSNLMTVAPGLLNGTNSGLCALNLAFQARPRVIRLYGMDLARGPRDERHWYADYPWQAPGKGTSNGSFANWRDDLEAAIAQCVAAGIEVIKMQGKS